MSGGVSLIDGHIDEPKKKIKWRWEYGVYGCFCPYCNEWAYEKDHCVFCGKPYEWVEPKHKETIIKQGKYTIVQATNNHISIYKSGEFVYHASCTEKKTEEELIKHLEFYKAMVSKSKKE